MGKFLPLASISVSSISVWSKEFPVDTIPVLHPSACHITKLMWNKMTGNKCDNKRKKQWTTKYESLLMKTQYMRF